MDLQKHEKSINSMRACFHGTCNKVMASCFPIVYASYTISHFISLYLSQIGLDERFWCVCADFVFSLLLTQRSNYESVKYVLHVMFIALWILSLFFHLEALCLFIIDPIICIRFQVYVGGNEY